MKNFLNNKLYIINNKLMLLDVTKILYTMILIWGLLGFCVGVSVGYISKGETRVIEIIELYEKPLVDTITTNGDIIIGDWCNVTTEKRDYFILETKSILKAYGFTKTQTAAIMGNIWVETGGSFYPGTVYIEKSGHTSYGIFQLNSCFHAKGGFDEIGYNIHEQIMYVLENNINNIREWVNKTSTNQDIRRLTFLFAKEFERCENCLTIEEYDKHQIKRTNKAITILSRFNNPNDVLYWCVDLMYKNF